MSKTRLTCERWEGTERPRWKIFARRKANSETRLLFLLVLGAPVATRRKSRLQLTRCRHACARPSACQRAGSQQWAVLFVVGLAAKQIEDQCQAAMGRCPKS